MRPLWANNENSSDYKKADLTEHGKEMSLSGLLTLGFLQLLNQEIEGLLGSFCNQILEKTLKELIDPLYLKEILQTVLEIETFLSVHDYYELYFKIKLILKKINYK